MGLIHGVAINSDYKIGFSLYYETNFMHYVTEAYIW
jgi:hypothetical protein